MTATSLRLSVKALVSTEAGGIMRVREEERGMYYEQAAGSVARRTP